MGPGTERASVDGPDPGGLRYHFGPLERRGLIAGWRGGQVTVVAVSLVVAVLVLRAGSSGAGLLGALLAVVIGLMMACWPVRGRTAEQWAPLVLTWSSRLLTGRRYHLSPVPVIGTPVPGTRLPASGGVALGRRRYRDAPAAAPGSLSGCRILAPPVAAGGLRIGVVHDSRARTYAAVVAAGGAAFALLEPGEQHRRISGWAGVLSGLARAGTAVHRLQWVERSLPGDVERLRRRLVWGTAPTGDDDAMRSYDQLAERTGSLAGRHEVLVVLSVHADRAARQIRAAGGGHEGACLVLAQEVRSLVGQLASAEVLVEGVLGPGALTQAMRQATQRRPGSRDVGQPPGDGGGGRPWPRPSGWPWPLASEVTWSNYRTDGAWHATYWVAEWPRVEVGPDFLSPLLLHSGARHSMAVVMEPVDPLLAVRQVQQARTADAADAELRRRGGFLNNARRQRETEIVARREVELADGHAQYRFSGYVTVTAGAPEALSVDCDRVEQAAGQARLELRRLYGQQDEAFTWTLPLARGLA